MTNLISAVLSIFGVIFYLSLLSCNLTCIVLRFLKEKKRTSTLLSLGKTIVRPHTWLFSSASLICLLRIFFIGFYVFLFPDASTFVKNVVLVLKYLENYYLMLNILVVVYIW